MARPLKEIDKKQLKLKVSKNAEGGNVNLDGQRSGGGKTVDLASHTVIK